MKQRLEIVDALRGMASLAVCWLHMTNGYSENSILFISGQYGRLGVEVFFVISGFIIPFALYQSGYKVTENWHIFMQKRIIRIDPPYIAAAVMAAVLWYMSALAPGFRGDEPNFSSTQLLLHLGYLNDIFDYPWLNPVFWTLAIEFQFYILLSLLFPIIVSSNTKLRIAGLMLICLVALLFPIKFFVFKYLCLFAVGIVTFQYFVKLIDVKEYLYLLIIVSVFLFISLGQAVTFVGVLTALMIAFVKLKKYIALHFLGAISYSLYLVHIPIGGRVVNLGKRFATSDVERFIVSLCSVALSIFAAYLFYRFIEKPSQNWSSRIAYLRKNLTHSICNKDIQTKNI